MSLKETLKQAKQIERQMKSKDERQTVTTNQLTVAIKPRNYLALNPLLKKGGIHEEDNVDAARKRFRRETKQQLRQTNWLSK